MRSLQLIRTALLANPIISGIVGTQVAPAVSAQGDKFPAILYNKTFEDPEYCQVGVSTHETNIQFHVFAPRYEQVITLIEELHKVLRSYQDNSVYATKYERGGAEDYLPDAKVYTDYVDYRFFIKQ